MPFKILQRTAVIIMFVVLPDDADARRRRAVAPSEAGRAFDGDLPVPSIAVQVGEQLVGTRHVAGHVPADLQRDLLRRRQRESEGKKLATACSR